MSLTISRSDEKTRNIKTIPPGQPSRRASFWRENICRVLGAEISSITRYYDQVLQWNRGTPDDGVLLSYVDCQNKTVVSGGDINDLSEQSDTRSVVLMNGTFNYELDIQRLLEQLRFKLSRSSRIVVVAYNSYFGWLYRLANALGLRKAEVPCTFLTETDVNTIAKLAGYEVVRSRSAVYCPFRMFGLGDLLNRVLPTIPVWRRLALSEVLCLRPVLKSDTKPSISIVIPARNEKKNIEPALRRLPEMPGVNVEVIFVEGHSTDATWAEIQRVIPLYAHRFPIKAFKQTGKGKADAVRLGFAESSNELLTILDADLSTPPELLPRFYDAYCRGLADFVNGNRLVYPTEGKAMKPLNKIGNLFFAKLLSRILGVRLGDTLCGTKLFSRSDYDRFIAWRKDFGDFDPFGDFELIFPAASLGLGIVDVPIHYRDRVYGETNISRFRHGFMLLQMSIIGFLKISLGRVR